MNLVSYTKKNIKQHHHTVSDPTSPKIEWVKNFSFFDPQYNIIVSGEAILSAENSEKSLGGQGSALNPAGELTALPKPAMWSETVGLRTRPV